jgi:PiT family inorganic phosphate transporter
MSPVLLVAIFLALVFAFLNGVHDSSNVVATMISSRAFSPRVALGTTALANFVGPFVFGIAVADTIGNEIVTSQSIDMAVILAALLSAIAWDVATWYLGFPSSSSHALIGGILGAVAVGAGWSAIQLHGLEKVLIALFSSPVIGFLLAFVLLRVVLFLSRDASPRVNGFFRNSQIVTGIALALSHGTNDSQKTMGVLALALVTGGYLKVFAVPTWVILICAAMIGLGTAVGGWRLIRTLGGKIFKIKPLDGFNAQITSASVIIGASLVGGPVSTTQVVSSAIMGTGAAERANKVRWGVAQEIAVAWLLTIPASALVAAGFYWILSGLGI